MPNIWLALAERVDEALYTLDEVGDYMPPELRFRLRSTRETLRAIQTDLWQAAEQHDQTALDHWNIDRSVEAVLNDNEEENL
jgi:hypothetical protein